MPALLLETTSMQHDFDRVCAFLLLEKMDEARWSLSAFYRRNSGSLAGLRLAERDSPLFVAIAAALLQFMRDWFTYLETIQGVEAKFDTEMPAWVGSVQVLPEEVSLGCPPPLRTRLEPHFLQLGIRLNSGELEFV